MSEEKTTTIIQTECPHCSAEILIPIESGNPSVKKIYTPQSVLDNKGKVKSEAVAMGLDAYQMQEVSSWLSMPETVITDDEVAPCLERIKQQYGK